MLDVLLILLVIFVSVTIVGHVTWLLIAACFKALAGPPDGSPRRASGEREQQYQDFLAFRRVVGAFRDRGWLAPEAAKHLFQLCRRAEEEWTATASPAERHRLAARSESHSRTAAERAESQRAEAQRAEMPGAPARANAGAATRADAQRTVAPPVTPSAASSAAPSVVLPAAAGQANGAGRAPRLARPAENQGAWLAPSAQGGGQTQAQRGRGSASPGRAASDVLHSFLIAHNIRWGELVAGILIVVCSIGLVISLWNTLTAAHRLLPAAVFLMASAAIEGAGLYTLRRWKLRHTSRAVLLIGTMLIPLSMMAGIAVAGRGAGAVSLDAASTWSVVAAGWLVCGALIFYGGRALVGRGADLWWTLAIGVPTAVLPLVPALARHWQQTTAWLLLGTALAVAVAIVSDGRQGRRDRRLRQITRRLGPAAAPAVLALGAGAVRRRLLLGAVGVYALAVLTAMLVLRLGAQSQVLVPLALGWIPVLAAAATSALSIRSASLRGTVRVTAVAIASAAGLAALALFPPSLSTFGWVASYTLLLALSTILFSWSLRTPLAIGAAPLAIGLFAPLAAVHWLGGVAWDDAVPLWRRYVSGEALLSLMAVAAVTLALSQLRAVVERWGDQGRRVLWRTGSGLAIAATLVGLAIGLGPSEWLGVLPRFAVVALLAAAAITAALWHSRGPHPVAIATFATLAAWATALVPMDVWFNQPLGNWLTPLTAAAVGSGWSVGLLGELARLVRLVGLVSAGGGEPPVPSAAVRSSAACGPGAASLGQWWHMAATLGTLGTGLAALTFAQHATLGLIATTAAAVLLLAAAIRTVDPRWLTVGQLGSLLTVGFAAVWLRPAWFLWIVPWETGDAWFAALAILASFVTVGAAFRLLAPLGPASVWRLLRRDRLRIDGYLAGLSPILWLVATAILTFRVFAGYHSDLPPVLPSPAFAIAAMVALWLAVGIWWRVALTQERQHRQPQGGFGSTADWFLAANLTLLSSALMITILATGNGFVAVAGIGWSILLLSAIASGGIIWWGRQATEARRRTLVVTLRMLSAFALLSVAGAALTLGFGPSEINPVRFLGLTGLRHWTLGTLTAWGIIATLVLAIVSKLVRSLPAGYCAALLAPVTAMLAWYGWQPLSTGLEGTAVGAATTLVAYLALRGLEALGCIGWLEALAWPGGAGERHPLGEPGQVPQLGQPAWHIALLGILATFAVAVGQIGLVWSGESQALSAAGPWGVTYGIAGGLLLAHSKFFRTAREDLIFILLIVGSGPVAAVGIAAGWLPASHGWVCIAALWLLAAIACGALAAVQRRSAPVVFAVALCGVVALGAAADRSQSLVGLVLWSVSTLAATAFGLAVDHRLRRPAAGQAIAAAAAASGLWLIAARVDGFDHQLAAAGLGLACLTVLWRLVVGRGIYSQSAPDSFLSGGLDLPVGDAACPTVKPAVPRARMLAAGFWQIDSVFAGVSLLSTAVLVWRLLSDATTAVAGLDVGAAAAGASALAMLLLSAPLHIRPAGSLVMAYIASQLLVVLGIACIWTSAIPVSPLAVLVTAGVLLAGIWVWTWPLRRQLRRFAGWRADESAPAGLLVGRGARWLKGWDAAADSRATTELLSMLLVAAAVTLGWASLAVVAGLEPNARWLMIGSVAGYGWLIAVAAAWWDPETAENMESFRATGRRNGSLLRMVAVLIFTAALLLTAAGLDPDARPWALLVAMRTLLSGVILVPMCLWVAPFLLALDAERWGRALRLGAGLGGSIAAASLSIMLALEWQLRSGGAVATVPLTLVIGIAILLAVLSAITAAIGLRPGAAGGVIPVFSDAARRWCLRAAQAIGGIAWLHVYLCRPELAMVGLRPYWPYLVLALAFGSAAIAEWGRRRGDAVVGDTLRQTTLYLPLIPVIGFWLSAGRSEWTYAGGAVSYAPLLLVTAVLYGGLAIMWRGVLFPRVAGIVAANLGLWVVLAQTPNFDFVSHPQLWLIPPAVCVLFAAHLERDRLEANMLAAIRYAAMLVIYISSTADVLLGEMGAGLAGPIILILLALAGIAAGAALRIRAFLYLGTLFVIVGVLSMVWHAQQAIDQVWPWWVFGITTGVLLLVGLMAIEKNKPKLRYWADSLAAWER